jgi:hypothetical protein
MADRFRVAKRDESRANLTFVGVGHGGILRVWTD